MYRKNKKLVAVAIPLSEKDYLSADEKISIKHLDTYLNEYDRYLIEPRGMKFKLDGYGVKEFDREFFGSLEAHRKMLFSEKFYNSFENYQFVLIYHTDALVFSDQLEYWCKKNYDYIAPPWVPHKDAPYAGNPKFEGKVGNGGFSLRKVASFLQVINSKRYWLDPVENLISVYKEHRGLTKVKKIAKALLKFIPQFNSVKQEMQYSRIKEDRFWADRAAHYYPSFNLAPLDVALGFGFECVPQYCYEINNFKLPFGCHAWAKYDRAFWEKYLIT